MGTYKSDLRKSLGVVEDDRFELAKDLGRLSRSLAIYEDSQSQIDIKEAVRVSEEIISRAETLSRSLVRAAEVAVAWHLIASGER